MFIYIHVQNRTVCRKNGVMSYEEVHEDWPTKWLPGPILCEPQEIRSAQNCSPSSHLLINLICPLPISCKPSNKNSEKSNLPLPLNAQNNTEIWFEITFLLELPDLLGARTVGISLLHDLEKQPRCLNPNINGCLWTFSTCTLLWNQQNRRLTAANWVPSTQNTHISEVVAAHHMLPSDGRLSGSNAMSGKTSTISCTSSCHWHDGLKFDWVSGPTWGRSFFTCRWGLKLSQQKQMNL